MTRGIRAIIHHTILHGDPTLIGIAHGETVGTIHTILLGIIITTPIIPLGDILITTIIGEIAGEVIITIHAIMNMGSAVVLTAMLSVTGDHIVELQPAGTTD